MTSASLPSLSGAPRPDRRPLSAGCAGAAALLLFGIADPGAALHGWLIGFAVAGGVPLGALALLLIHAVTGGRWGETQRPALVALAAAVPGLILLVLPLVFGARFAYPWAADPTSAGAGVAKLYLNAPAVGLRSVLGLGILSAVAWRLARGRPSRLAAALGLCVYALFMNAAAYDWLLSLAPRFTSSAFGAQVIVGQMLSALCCVVLVSGAPNRDSSWADIAGLMLATTLGESYLVLMALAINWYGDLPDQAAWYMSRTLHGWVWLEAAGALFGSALPMAAMLFARVRATRAWLRIVALAILAGLLIEGVWLVAPATEPVSALAGVVGVVAVGGLLVAAGRRLALRGAGPRHGT